jgi:hypothetical protein
VWSIVIGTAIFTGLLNTIPSVRVAVVRAAVTVWCRIRAAVTQVNAKARGKHRIPPTASAYSFRHARISELLQVHGIDPLTVAHQTGTSTTMIEKSYLRFIPSAMQEKLNAVRAS